MTKFYEKNIPKEKHYPPEDKSLKLRNIPTSFDYWSYSSNEDPLAGINLDEEYLLILEKRSKLPSSIRGRIVELKRNNVLDFIFSEGV